MSLPGVCAEAGRACPALHCGDCSTPGRSGPDRASWTRLPRARGVTQQHDRPERGGSGGTRRPQGGV